MLRALLTERLRSCGPTFGFLARVLGAHVFDIVICEIALLERHCNPVFARFVGVGHLWSYSVHACGYQMIKTQFGNAISRLLGAGCICLPWKADCSAEWSMSSRRTCARSLRLSSNAITWPQPKMGRNITPS